MSLRDDSEMVPWAVTLAPDVLKMWSWQGRTLVHRDASPRGVPSRELSALHQAFVRNVYATQNSSRVVRATLKRLLSSLGPNEWGLNFGAGGTRIDSRILTLDISNTPGLDIVSSGTSLPFADSSLSLVISQEVLEHVPRPNEAVAEICRVLKPGGRFYCQIPFIIGYHPGPTDFWRFTKEGLTQLFADRSWKIQELDISLGHGSGFYRIAVEYIAVTCSVISNRLYIPAKALASVACLPFKIPDVFTARSPQRDRIPGGYYCIVEKL